MFAWVLGRICSKLESWKEKLLSKVGKEVLLKTVIQALPQYAMSIFKLPVFICKTIEQKIASFWWKTNEKKEDIHWKRWELLKTRKDRGDMGFRDLLSFNKAMLGKQTWRLAQQPDSLWARLFQGLYYLNTDIWHAVNGTRPSWGWRSLVLGRETIAPKIMWKVGDGSKIKIREDKWLHRGIIEGPVNVNEPALVSELIDKEQGRWDDVKIAAHFDEQLAEEILTIPIKPQTEADQLVWTGTQAGKYTVKSAYNYIKEDKAHIQEN